MRFGCCGSLVASGPDRTGVEIVERLAEYGYDYIELPLADMMELDGGAFGALRARVEATSLRCETCNNFFPARVRLTGPEADLDAARGYCARALDRAAELGAAVVVFGSAGAKRVPDGFPMERAWEQVAEITRYAGEEAAKRGVTIAIEPVRHPDCNIINTFAEGVAMARETGLDSVKVLVDIYHLACEGENPDILRKYGAEYLRHVHFSFPNFPEIDGVSGPEKLRGIFEGELARRGWWRTWPSSREEWGYAPFIQALKGCGYDGRISIEAPVGDFEVQAPRTLAFLKEAF